MQIQFSDVISLLALGVSAWSMKRTHDSSLRADRLNDLLIQKESAESEAQKKAEVSANFVKIGKNDWQLKVFNRGTGTARNVRLECLDEAATELLFEDEIRRKFPIPVLEQHQHADLIVAVHMQSPSRAHLRLIWDDDTGKDRQKDVTPTL